MKRLVRLCSVILLCSICLSQVASAVAVANSTSSNNSFVANISSMINSMPEDDAARFADVVLEEAENISVAFGAEVKPACAKELLDFAGNSYTLIECSPSGYMIYHNASGQFVEFAASSPSPYDGFDENLYYGGPTEYYVFSDGTFSHTLINEEYTETEGFSFAESCEEAHNNFLIEKDTAILNYISGNSSASLTEALAASTMSTSETAPTYITNAYCICNCETHSEMSYFEPENGGACGYIASAMLILWFRDTINANYLNYNSSSGVSYVTLKNGYPVFNGSPDDYTNGQTFSYNLWRWHSEFGNANYKTGNFETEAGDIATTLQSYVTAKGLHYDYTIDVFPSTATIISKLDNKDKPYILCGNLQPADESKTRSDHAVLVYGHYNGYLLCHYGMLNYTCSSIKGTWRTGYMMLP